MEHYPRLVRLAYVLAPPALPAHRRVLAAHALVQRSLPRNRDALGGGLPPQRGQQKETNPRGGLFKQSRRRGGAGDDGGRGGQNGATEVASAEDDAYAWLRTRTVAAALAGERPRRLGPLPLPRLPRRPAALPRVLGLRLAPREASASGTALDDALAEVSAAARAAYALRAVDDLTDAGIRCLLAEAGVADPDAALREADEIGVPAADTGRALLLSAQFDACSLRAAPTALGRRRQHGRAAIVAAVALAVCGALLGLPGDAWGPDGAAAPLYARNPVAERALSPGALVRVPAGEWKDASRADFSVWPARGELTGNQALLRRALAVWARPGPQVTVSATRGTPAGPPAGPPHLLYAGRVDGTQVVLLHDGLRLARYAEPEGAKKGGAVLDLARTDGADAATAAAVVVSRIDSNVRYLTAPWVTEAAEADLLQPRDDGRPLRREHDGMLAAVTGPKARGGCSRWPGLMLTSQTPSGASKRRLYTDLGELPAVRLTYGSPRGKVREATSGKARRRLAHTSCALRSMAGGGVETVNTWRFKEQTLPEAEGVASWTCTRGETWRGGGAQVLGAFQPPAEEADEPAAVTARAVGSPMCGKRSPHVVSAARWQSQAGNWYVLAAGSSKVTSIRAVGRGEGSPTGYSPQRTLALPGTKRSKVKLSARLTNGEKLAPLRTTRTPRG